MGEQLRGQGALGADDRAEVRGGTGQGCIKESLKPCEFFRSFAHEGPYLFVFIRVSGLRRTNGVDQQPMLDPKPDTLCLDFFIGFAHTT
ncbi:hypothetical protein AB0C19_02035 [Micromonospora sp. NPDC048842]|uniref:hypothetical protein n=1 Tax=Micromonospora sp. NPDC048842 TaxID=3154346 RepID=UPI0033C2CE10